MGYFLGVILILLLTFSLCHIIKRSFAYCLPFSILTIISILYLFGLFTILKIGAYILSASILVLFAIVLILILKDKSKFNFKFSNFSFIFFISFAVFQFFILKDKYITAWDEFSHWGTIVKNMFYFGNFGNIDIQVNFPGYPPATGIFHVFFMFLGNKFVEGFVFMSMNLLTVALILPIFDNLTPKFSVKNLLIGFVGLLVPAIFADYLFFSIYVDSILGFMFAYMIITYLSSHKIDYLLIVNLSLTSFVLCISKAAGLGICLIALIIIMLHAIIFQKEQLKIFLKNKLNILGCLMPIVAIAIAKISWNSYLTFFKLNEAWDVSTVTFSGVLKAFISPTDYQSTIIKNFITKLFNPLVFNRSLILIVLSVCLGFCIPFLLKKKNTNDPYLIISLFVGFVIYLISTLILYLFTYTEYEALNLSSFDRYCSTYVIACALIMFYRLLANKSFEKLNKLKIMKFLEYTSLGLCVLGVTAIAVIGTAYTKISIGTRNEVKDFQTFVSTLDSTKDRVWFVDCDSTGFNYHQAAFISTPMLINDNFTWSLGAARRDGDIWSLNISADQWKELLKTGNYTYVYLQNIDNIFSETYGEIFDSKENIADLQKFKVEISNDDVRLIKI